MAVTRINNNQITDAVAGNTYVGINANTKLQNYSITAGKIANNLTYGSDLTVAGNLTVQGTSTAIDTTITTIEDPVIILASTQTGTPAVDIGYLGERGDSENIAFVWDESADEFVTVFTSTAETNTVVTISSYANFHTNDANIGGNIVINGTTSYIGNITGNLNVTGNIAGGNLLTPGLISATGNITGGNLSAGSGIIVTTGNINGGNLNATTGITSVTIDATGNINGNNINSVNDLTAEHLYTTGNAYIGGNLIVSGNLSYININDLRIEDPIIILGTGPNGAPLTSNDGLDRGIYMEYYITGTGTANAFMGFDNSTGNMFIASNVVFTSNDIVQVNSYGTLEVGNIYSQTTSATGNITGGNLNTAGQVVATGNVNGGNIVTSNTVTGSNVIGTTSGTFGNIVISGDDITDTNGRVNFNTAGADVDFAVNGDTVANIFYVDAGSGTASFGNAVQTVNSIVAFNSTNSILVPVGSTSQRPTGVTGQFRFNTTSNSLEIYDNSEWVSVGVPVFTLIDDQQFNGDGSTVAFTLNSTQTTNSCIVSINGVVQIPTLAYAVAGTDPTCVLTFTEAPEPGDIIDVRLLTTTISVTSISNSSGNARISVNPTEGTVNVTGNLVPTANLAFNLGSPTNQWNELYISGNSIYIGDVILKANNGNLKVRNFDDTADAGVEGTFISTSTTSGNLQIGLNHIEATNLNGNIDLRPNGVGYVTVNTQLSAVGNITGSYIFGNGSQLTGIDATSIQNGTSNVRVVSSGGNITTSVGGNANVVVVSTAGATITGNVTATSNMVIGTAGNSIIFNAGNNFEIQNTVSNGNINFRANVNGAGPENVFRCIGTGGIAFAGNLVSMFGNGAVANGVANIGSPTSTFNTIFAKATSAQYADLAEKYVADAEYAPGVVVEFGGTNEVTVCNSDSTTRVAGVISTNPSYRMNDGLDSEFTAMVALTGRVPTHVVGPVRKGDMMVAAGNGRARAEADPKVGSVIGKALADFDGTEGVIEVVVGRV
jgi:hypothetical protein